MRIASLLVSVAVAACSSSSSSPNDGGTSASTQCTALAAAVCEAVVQCGSDAAPDVDSVSACTAHVDSVAVQGGKSCSQATSVASTYNLCMQSVPNTPCSTLIISDYPQLPADCVGVIQ